MKKIILFIILIICGIFLTLFNIVWAEEKYGGKNMTGTSIYFVGQKWSVEYYYTHPSPAAIPFPEDIEVQEIFYYEVLEVNKDVIEMGIRDKYSLKNEKPLYIIVLGADNLVLKRILEYNIFGENIDIIENIYNDNPYMQIDNIEGGAMNLKNPPIFDWIFFTDFEKTKHKKVSAKDEKPFELFINRKDKGFLEIEMKTELFNKELKCVQYWNKDSYFWDEAVRFYDGKEIIKGKLIKVNDYVLSESLKSPDIPVQAVIDPITGKDITANYLEEWENTYYKYRNKLFKIAKLRLEEGKDKEIIIKWCKDKLKKIQEKVKHAMKGNINQELMKIFAMDNEKLINIFL